MSANAGRLSVTRATPWAVAAGLGIAWRMPSEALITWDALLDRVCVAYWLRRPVPVPCDRRSPSEVPTP